MPLSSRRPAQFPPGCGVRARRPAAFPSLAALLLALGAGCAAPPGPIELHEATIAELQRAMERGETTALEIVDGYLARIEAYDEAGPALNALIALNPQARETARALDDERSRSGPRGPLHGIPILLKDNLNTGDLPTTGGSIALEGMVPPEDATLVRRLREAGAIVLGKTNLHEFAYGYTTISSLGGQTRNPYDPERIPGGSSGGTGAGISASFAAIGYGTDTCGSVRVPAAFNGLFGLRPTLGVVSRHGILPLSLTQDTAGPLARTVADLALAFAVVAAPDPADPATEVSRGRDLGTPADWLRPDALRGARIGLLTEHFGSGEEEAEVSAVVRSAAARMAEAGAVVFELSLPWIDTLLAGTSVIAQEFRTDLERYLATVPGAPVVALAEIVEGGLHDPAIAGSLRASLAAAGPGSDGHQRSLERRMAAREAVTALLIREGLDALAYPTVRREPAPIGGGQAGVNCQLSAATGLPALSAPAGRTAAGLPVGIELLGGPFEDGRLIGLAFAYEQAAGPRLPPASTPPLPAMGSVQP